MPKPIRAHHDAHDTILWWIRSNAAPSDWVMRLGQGRALPCLVVDNFGLRPSQIVYQGDTWDEVLTTMRIAGEDL